MYIIPHSLLHSAPLRHTQVLLAEQQIAKRRVKRDYTSPTDQMWPKQWYLVSLYLHILSSLPTLFFSGSTCTGLITYDRYCCRLINMASAAFNSLFRVCVCVCVCVYFSCVNGFQLGLCRLCEWFSCRNDICFDSSLCIYLLELHYLLQ